MEKEDKEYEEQEEVEDKKVKTRGDPVVKLY